MINKLIQYYIKAYERFGLKEPENAMENCSEFSIACALVGKEANQDISVIPCKIRSNHTFDWYVEGDFYPHCLLKINGEYYDFTIAQFNQNNNEYFIGAFLPEYIKEVESPMELNEDPDNFFNDYHKYLISLLKNK